MGRLMFWTMVAVLYQTSFSIIISWLTLSCKFHPEASELHEITLIKLLYLYDPEACGRIYFYNFTRAQPVPSSIIIWPVKNDVAAQFHEKLRIWLALHILWLLFGVAYSTLGQKLCVLYATLLPFTFVGVAILITDLVYTVSFLMVANQTSTEDDILKYIHIDNQSIRSVTVYPQPSLRLTIFGSSPSPVEDTSWISLLFAYISCRAVVQWIINFWLVKDNFYEGVAYHHRLTKLLELHSGNSQSHHYG